MAVAKAIIWILALYVVSWALSGVASEYIIRNGHWMLLYMLHCCSPKPKKLPNNKSSHNVKIPIFILQIWDLKLRKKWLAQCHILNNFCDSSPATKKAVLLLLEQGASGIIKLHNFCTKWAQLEIPGLERKWIYESKQFHSPHNSLWPMKNHCKGKELLLKEAPCPQEVWPKVSSSAVPVVLSNHKPTVITWHFRGRLWLVGQESNIWI